MRLRAGMMWRKRGGGGELSTAWVCTPRKSIGPRLRRGKQKLFFFSRVGEGRGERGGVRTVWRRWQQCGEAGPCIEGPALRKRGVPAGLDWLQGKQGKRGHLREAQGAGLELRGKGRARPPRPIRQLEAGLEGEEGCTDLETARDPIQRKKKSWRAKPPQEFKPQEMGRGAANGPRGEWMGGR